MNVKDKVVLVTGSTTGLGKEIALNFGRAGARVVMNYANNAARAEKAFEELMATGCEGRLIRASVVDAGEIASMVNEIEASLGAVDVVALNATPDQPHKPIEDYDWAFYQQMLDFFVKSPFLVARAVLPKMKEKRQGRIINIGSEVYQLGVGNFSAYVAAKGGQAGWTRSMATELAPWNITVNLISPGWIPVERHEKDPQEEKDAYRATIPLNRWGKPADVAAAALYFASEEASFVTGQNLCVNGGKSYF